MKKIILLLIAWGSYVCTNAQTIIAAEFFVDVDPGVGNGTAITVSPTGANVNFSASIPTGALSNGFHIVGIRTKDNLGKWGLYENRGFYISSSTTNVGNITAAEFFVDTDPGVGNGTPITVTSGANVNFVATVPTTSLAAGFHFVAIRTKDVDGKWGLFENRGFYISTSTTNVGNISAAEFFVDADPGVGNGTPIAVTSGANVNFVASVPTTSLSSGFHFVAIRTKDINGKWGLFENRGFYISTSTTNVGNIIAAEFFVDADPGVGNGTPIAVTSGANVNFVASVPTTSLSNGFHFIAIRTKDVNGKWGLFENRGFYISTQTNNSAGMTAAEYFIDTDPGVGNGTPFTIPGGQSFNQNFVLPIPLGTSQGQHFIAIRTKNDWGLFEFDTVTVSGVVTPLKLLNFDAVKNQTTVLLKWKTTNEVNTAYFDIERSTNGTMFTKIGKVNSLNTLGNNNYFLQDNQPNKGVNFYRLKQVDLDGKFVYSIIIKVLFDEYGRVANVYPNPTSDFIKIDFTGKQNTVLISVYDALGRQVLYTSMPNQQPLKLSVNHLPKGKYVVQLSDGETNNTASFIKQ
jgi:Secretion system C-terminal sorting domain